MDPPHTRESLVEVVNSGGGYHIHSRVSAKERSLSQVKILNLSVSELTWKRGVICTLTCQKTYSLGESLLVLRRLVTSHLNLKTCVVDF